MSKFLIFFYTFLFLQVVWADAKDDTLNSVQVAFNKLLSFVNQASEEVEKAFNEANAKGTESTTKLQNGALTIIERTMTTVKVVINKLDNEISNLKENYKNMDVSKCGLLADDYRYNVAHVIVDSSICLTELFDETSSYIDNMDYVSKNVLKNFKNIKEEGKQCTSVVKGVLDIPKALLCLTKLTTKASKVIAEDVPAATAEISKISIKLSDTSVNAAACYLEKSIFDVAENAKVIIDEIAKCMSKLNK